MRILGVMTEDFQFFYRLVRRLKERSEPFVSLDFSDPVPLNVAVIITTPAEKEKVSFPAVAVGTDPDQAINLAKALLAGRHFKLMTIGIDPGRTTGVAVLGNGKLLLTDTFTNPEEADKVVRRLIAGLDHDELLVRIGHGDRTIRNRIIRSLWGVADRFEIVDETNTTKRTEMPDIDAAILISKTMGEELDQPPMVAPTEGELREIKRQSRLASEGAVTLPSDLARKVAQGELDMEEALAEYSDRGRKGGRTRT